MREILFRGKRLDNGEWFIGCDIWRPWFLDQNFITISDHKEMVKVDPQTVGQFTGLTDKNGKKIFEGDILDTSGTELASWPYNGFTEVEWDYNISGFNPFVDYDSDCGIFTEPKKCVVIGNIHDNPELLRKTDNDGYRE